LGCRFKLSFGNFGADIVAVQLFVNELGHPQGLMSTLFANFYREEVGVILCALLCSLHDKKHFWQVPLFFLAICPWVYQLKGLNNELLPGRISHYELVAHPTILALYTPMSVNCHSIAGLSFWTVLCSGNLRESLL
jgi:hypothetical protein